jgi:hypothetical protein
LITVGGLGSRSSYGILYVFGLKSLIFFGWERRPEIPWQIIGIEVVRIRGLTCTSLNISSLK